MNEFLSILFWIILLLCILFGIKLFKGNNIIRFIKSILASFAVCSISFILSYKFQSIAFTLQDKLRFDNFYSKILLFADDFVLYAVIISYLIFVIVKSQIRNK